MQRLVTLLLCCALLPACDLLGLGTETHTVEYRGYINPSAVSDFVNDNTVYRDSIRYDRATVLYIDERGESVSDSVSLPWTYTFEAEKGAQLLIRVIPHRRWQSVAARITVDDETSRQIDFSESGWNSAGVQASMVLDVTNY